MMKKLKRFLVISAGLIFLNCCTTIPDVPICTEITMTRGWCTNTISDVEFYVDEKNPYDFGGDGGKMDWWSLRPLMVMVPFPSWAELKAYLIKNCKRTDCDKYIKSWERRVNKLDDKVKNE